MLREGETERVPLLSSIVPIIIVGGGGEVETATSKKEKRALLSKAIEQNWQAYAVWPGKWSSDVFLLDVDVAFSRVWKT